MYPRVTAAVKDVVRRLEAIPGVAEIESPLNASDRANTVSEDGRVKQLDSVSLVLPTCSKLAVIGGSS